jgi:hypothetical protein
MANWEYRSITIRYRGKRVKDWVSTADPDHVGMQAILDRHSADGWELVSLNPEQMEAGPGFGRWYIDTTVYRATFKRMR